MATTNQELKSRMDLKIDEVTTNDSLLMDTSPTTKIELCIVFLVPDDKLC